MDSGTRVSTYSVLTVSSTPRTSFGVHCRSRENAEKRRPGLAAFSNNNAVFFLDQSTQHFDIGPYKTTFRKHRSNNFGSHIYVDCLRPYCHIHFMSTLGPILRDRLNLRLADPKLMTFRSPLHLSFGCSQFKKLFPAILPRQPM